MLHLLALAPAGLAAYAGLKLNTRMIRRRWRVGEIELPSHLARRSGEFGLAGLAVGYLIGRRHRG